MKKIQHSAATVTEVRALTRQIHEHEKTIKHLSRQVQKFRNAPSAASELAATLTDLESAQQRVGELERQVSLNKHTIHDLQESLAATEVPQRWPFECGKRPMTDEEFWELSDEDQFKLHADVVCEARARLHELAECLVDDCGRAGLNLGCVLGIIGGAAGTLAAEIAIAGCDTEQEFCDGMLASYRSERKRRTQGARSRSTSN